MNTNPYKCGRCGSEFFFVATNLRDEEGNPLVSIDCDSAVVADGCSNIATERTMEAAWAAITKKPEPKEERKP